MSNSHKFFSSSIQITQDNSRHPFGTDYGYIHQEVTPDIIDVSYVLGENKNIPRIFEDLNQTKLNLFQFYFNVNVPDYKPENDDIHYNHLVHKILDSYLSDINIFGKLFQPENMNDVLRVYVKRLFSYTPTKHIFCIGIISLKNHKGDWGELKNNLANQEFQIHIQEKTLQVKGQYPIDIADLNGVYPVEA